jgi:streptomycin 6-kinase
VEHLAWIRTLPGGAEWLEAAPRLAVEAAEQWGLKLGPPFARGMVSLVLPACDDAVLKVQFPHGEDEHEAEALRVWNGDGAVRLLAHDEERHALLLERCVPGTHLREVGADAALDVAVSLLPRLWKPAGAPFRPLAEEASGWAERMPATWEAAGRPFERRLLEAALEALRELPSTQGEQVLLHQDLHADNILAAHREPWLAIDPKPLTGEREFGVAALVRAFELGATRRDLLHRLDRLTSELGLDRDRAARWTLAQTVAWSFGSGYFAEHIQTARRLLDALSQ